MIDFASALYLGMRHETCSLRPWKQITAGVPAALDPVEGAEMVAAQVAALQGCEAATVGTSTLHLVWDLLGLAGSSYSAIYLDAGAYPVLRWGVERVAAHGVSARDFRHYDANALATALRTDSAKGAKPLVVADGLCPGCGRVAPIRAYLECVRRYGGTLVLDDTQALGILGHSSGPATVYGKGGGGSLRWSGVSAPDLIVVSSMAKGFGVPAAVLCGSRDMIIEFEARSETRMHCSPPSVASLRAAENALQVNRRKGELLRSRLAALILQFRRRLKTIGLVPDGGLFPVQTISTFPPAQAFALHEHLLNSSIRTVLHGGSKGRGTRISFLINADHRTEQIDYAAIVLSDKLREHLGSARAAGSDWER